MRMRSPAVHAHGTAHARRFCLVVSIQQPFFFLGDLRHRDVIAVNL
jgi:hypothetical protein